jgi:drug/metabolite transporter (DMT)-like permease
MQKTAQKTAFTAASWMVGSAFCSALMVIMVRFVDTSISVPQMIFMRNGFGVLMFLPFILVKGKSFFSTKRLKNHFYRSLSGVFAMLIFFYCIRKMELPVVVAITYTVPLFSSIMAYYYFNDRPGIQRICAMVVGFIGVLIVIRPGFEGFTPLSFLMVLCSIFWAVSGILIKDLGKTEQPLIITFYLTLFMTLLTFPIMLFFGWTSPSFESTMWIIGIAFVSVVLQYCLSNALAIADISFLYAFDYTRLIFVSLFAYFIFNEVVDAPTIIGSSIIIISAVYTTYRESKKGKKRVVPATSSGL